MKLKELYLRLYERIFSIRIFKKLLAAVPVLEKLLQWEIVSYLVFGGLTTAVNLLTYWLVNLPWGERSETAVLFTVGSFDFRWIYAANAIAWIAAMLFSFVTNKLFVFESAARDRKTVARELSSFLGARLISFFLFEELLFGLLASFMNSWFAKLIVAVFVIVFNFVASKLVIFRKKREKPGEEAPEC